MVISFKLLSVCYYKRGEFYLICMIIQDSQELDLDTIYTIVLSNNILRKDFRRNYQKKT